ncbi:MAG: hypothetical protein ACRBBS_13220 [Thalassovita sp.]
MQYEFRSRTLQKPVRNSLQGNARVSLRRKDDTGGRDNCRQLASWIDQLVSETCDIENSTDDIDRLIGNLRQSRRDGAISGAIGTASAAAGPLASELRVARLVRRLPSGGGTNLADVVSAVPVIGGAILDGLERIANAIEGTARELNNQLRQNRCEIHFS